MASTKTGARRTPGKDVPAALDTMRSAAIDRFGPPGELALRMLPVPAPGPGQVLIAIHAAGVGVWDAMVRDGSWRPEGEPRFPFIPGTDGAGTVAALGAGVRRLGIGDRVWAARIEGGFYAEYIAVDAANVGPAPLRLDLIEAGAAAVTGLTALQGIELLRIRRGQTVLVFGASGAVGTLAVQLARHRGARVIATATGREAKDLVEDLGADATVDARGEDLLDRIREAAPDGIDGALALAGGPALERCLDHIRQRGRAAYPHGVEPEPRERPGLRIMSYDAAFDRRHLDRLAKEVEETGLRVPVAAAFPLEEAARAHERLARDQILGRIVLRVR